MSTCDCNDPNDQVIRAVAPYQYGEYLTGMMISASWSERNFMYQLVWLYQHNNPTITQQFVFTNFRSYFVESMASTADMTVVDIIGASVEINQS